MKKRINILLFALVIILLSTFLTIYTINKIKIYIANNEANKIEIGDNLKIEDLENIEKQEIMQDYFIGTLTIPDILLKDSAILESVELSTLEKEIGHFNNTSIYIGNVGLAGHNSR